MSISAASRRGVRSFVSGSGECAGSERFDADSWDFIASRMTISMATPPAPRSAPLPGKLERRASRTGGNALFYLAIAGGFSAIVQPLGEAGLRRGAGGGLAARHHREAVRHRSASARRSTRQPQGAGRSPGLSHRSFSRQGDRAEHHGPPLRQRHLRAAVEPRPYRPCADHRRRDRGGRAPRRFYDATGALRDMVPNHLFQLLA